MWLSEQPADPQERHQRQSSKPGQVTKCSRRPRHNCANLLSRNAPLAHWRRRSARYTFNTFSTPPPGRGREVSHRSIDHRFCGWLVFAGGTFTRVDRFRDLSFLIYAGVFVIPFAYLAMGNLRGRAKGVSGSRHFAHQRQSRRSHLFCTTLLNVDSRPASERPFPLVTGGALGVN